MKILEPLFIEVAKQLIHHEYEISSSKNNNSFFFQRSISHENVTNSLTPSSFLAFSS
jgi:hypothetical protein